jgi:hypothetical protein
MDTYVMQVRVIVEMPAWVLSVTLASETVQQGVENAVFVSDADANIKRLPVSLTLEADTCTMKYASRSSFTVVERQLYPAWHNPVPTNHTTQSSASKYLELDTDPPRQIPA